MIEGVRLRQLVPHHDHRGSLTEILRSDWPEFRGFGQATVTMNYPGVIRAWHWHLRQQDLFVVVSGIVRLPVYDARDGSATRGALDEFLLGEGHFAALVVPAGVYHGYQTVSLSPALILNFPDQLYDPTDPDEQRIPHDDPRVPYSWQTVD